MDTTVLPIHAMKWPCRELLATKTLSRRAVDCQFPCVMAAAIRRFSAFKLRLAVVSAAGNSVMSISGTSGAFIIPGMVF